MVNNLILPTSQQAKRRLPISQTPSIRSFTVDARQTRNIQPLAPSVILLIPIKILHIVIPAPSLPPRQLLRQRLQRHLPHLALLKHHIRLPDAGLLQILQFLQQRFEPAGLQAFEVVVAHGVHDDQRLVAGLGGIGEREGYQVVVVHAAAEVGLLAVAGAHVGAAVEGGGPVGGEGGWVVALVAAVEAWECWEWPHCFSIEVGCGVGVFGVVDAVRDSVVVMLTEFEVVCGLMQVLYRFCASRSQYRLG